MSEVSNLKTYKPSSRITLLNNVQESQYTRFPVCIHIYANLNTFLNKTVFAGKTQK